MKSLKVGVLALALVVTGKAVAQPHPVTSPGSAASSAALTRAEVRADLTLWRQAGMGDFTMQEQRDAMLSRYQAALKRYHELRSSPAYDQLVRRLSGGSMVLVSEQ